MDILKDFKGFLLGEGLNQVIHSFRNPSWDQIAYLDVEYLPEIDSCRMSTDDPQYLHQGGKVITPFTVRLVNECNRKKKELSDSCESYFILFNRNKSILDDVIKASDTNFNEVREMVKSNIDFNPYHEILFQFITDIEIIYTRFSNTIIGNSNESILPKHKKSEDQQKLSFHYMGSKELLKSIYFLPLKKGEFIDNDKTPLSKFIEILTSMDLHNTNGEIHLGCQTRQGAYIIKKMQNYFKNLQFKVIQDSGKIKSKKGKIISANSFSSSRSKSEHFKDQELIDEFFEKVTL